MTILDPAAFIRANTRLQPVPHAPEISLWLADEITPIWRLTEEELGEMGVPPPFWAFAWAGGQALSRYILDHPHEVAGKRVLDFAAGSGLVGVAAMQAGAAVDAASYSALLLPGGVANPDLLRADADAVAFVRAFFDAGKPVAAICHAPWLLIEAGVVEGRTMTSFESIRTDLKNAGANVVNEEVVVDQGLVTSRCPDDIPAFNAKMIEEFGEGRHDGQTA